METLDRDATTDLDRPFTDHAQALARAEEGVAALAAARRDRWYPRFHIASAGSWINDPNGLCHFQGRWHVFFQLHPFSAQWGPMHWGHVSSADLVTWRREPVALAPSIEAERAGVFSGSAAVDDAGALRLYYTGHRWHNGRDNGAGNREVQCLATSTDGVTFTKRGVVVPNPEDLVDFRDPKVWRQDGAWWMVFGRRSAGNRGQIVLHRSADGVAWEFDQVLFEHPDPHVYMLECPDFFPLEGADGTVWVLCFSAMGAKKQGYLNRSKNNAGYCLGTWRPGEAFMPTTEHRLWDWGPNFYAPQTMAAPDGRRLMIGWMCPDHEVPCQEDGWCGQLTLPREVTLGPDGDIVCAPARELAALRADTVELGPVTLGCDEELVLAENADAMEVELALDLARTTVERGGIRLHATENGNYVYVAYDDESGRVVVDRQTAALGERGYRAAPLGATLRERGVLELRIFIDRSAVEVYIDGGEQVMTALSFPVAGPHAVKLTAESGTLVAPRVTLHRLRSIGLA